MFRLVDTVAPLTETAVELNGDREIDIFAATETSRNEAT